MTHNTSGPSPAELEAYRLGVQHTLEDFVKPLVREQELRDDLMLSLAQQCRRHSAGIAINWIWQICADRGLPATLEQILAEVPIEEPFPLTPQISGSCPDLQLIFIRMQKADRELWGALEKYEKGKKALEQSLKPAVADTIKRFKVARKTPTKPSGNGSIQ